MKYLIPTFGGFFIDLTKVISAGLRVSRAAKAAIIKTKRYLTIYPVHDNQLKNHYGPSNAGNASAKSASHSAFNAVETAASSFAATSSARISVDVFSTSADSC